MRIFKMKIGIDILMTILLLLLMAYQIVGEFYHEWLGAGMLVLFIVHNILNRCWYVSLLKGRYNPVRIFRTIVNLALLASMLCMAYSGMVMSRHVFVALPINSGMALSREMHLAGSYWSFVLMSVHLGVHWGMVTGKFCKLFGVTGFKIWIVRLTAAAIAGYGAICFWKADCFSYMFLRVEFAFLDYEKSAAVILTEYMAMMGFWVFPAYYVSKVLGKRSMEKINRKEN